MSTVKNAFEEMNKGECFGYLPTSSSTKPAHVANGWFRRVLGRRYDPALLNQTVVHWTQKGEVNPSEKLLDGQPSVFEPFQPQSKRREFAEFRADLRQLVSPLGGAVNRGNNFSSYNVTCDRHLTEDRSDNATGAFLHALIATDLGTGPSPVLSLLKEILENPKDEVSALTCPLVVKADPTDIAAGTYPAESVFKKRGKVFVSPVLRHLREGFDNLARFEQQYGGGLDALRRFVAFGVFSVLLHMQNRQADFAGTAELTPTLLYFAERQRNTAYQASHATYNLNRRAIETLYTGRFRDWLEPRVGVKPTEKKCEGFIAELEFGQGNDDKSRAHMLRAFRSFASQMNRLDAMAESLRETVFRDLSGTPLDFYRGLGVRSGFVRPAGNNAVRKYYTLEGVLLEAVLASVLPDGETTYQNLLAELHRRYGLLLGGRPEDAGVLMDNGIGTATVQDLRANSHAFRQQLLSLGWGRQYADAVMMVHVPEGLR
jgi:hypothetical protein